MGSKLWLVVRGMQWGKGMGSPVKRALGYEGIRRENGSASLQTSDERNVKRECICDKCRARRFPLRLGITGIEEGIHFIRLYRIDCFGAVRPSQ